jgi:hypothetical protein
MLDNEGLEQKLAESPAPRVTKDQIDARIAGVEFNKLGETLTHCAIKLDNGFIVTGESACVNAANYNKEIGEKIAYDNAFNKLWAFFGFLLAEGNFVAANVPLTSAVEAAPTEEQAAA